MTQYFVGTQHGQGTTYSQVYVVSDKPMSLAEAEKAAEEYRAAHPEHEGWNRFVGVCQWDKVDKKAYWIDGEAGFVP